MITFEAGIEGVVVQAAPQQVTDVTPRIDVVLADGRITLDKSVVFNDDVEIFIRKRAASK